MPSKTFARIRNALSLVSAATAVSAAIESRHRPAARDLKRLGISEDAFSTIRF